MTQHIDTTKGTVLVSTDAGPQEAYVLAKLRVETVSGDLFPLLVTYHPGDGTGAAVTEPWTWLRVCRITPEDLQSAGFLAEKAGRAAYERLIGIHGAPRVESSLRRARATKEE